MKAIWQVVRDKPQKEDNLAAKVPSPTDPVPDKYRKAGPKYSKTSPSLLTLENPYRT